MRRAFAWARERDGRIEGDFPGLRSQLVSEAGRGRSSALSHCAISMPKELETDPSYLARSAELVEEPELRTWWLQRDRLQPYLDELTIDQRQPARPRSLPAGGALPWRDRARGRGDLRAADARQLGAATVRDRRTSSGHRRGRSAPRPRPRRRWRWQRATGEGARCRSARCWRAAASHSSFRNRSRRKPNDRAARSS